MHPNFNKTQENVFNRRNGELKRKKNKYHRRIMHARDELGEVINNVACVQYVYDKEEIKFAMKPVKSSNNGKGVPFTRTKPSEVRNLHNEVASLGPKDAVSMTTQSRVVC